VVVAVLLPEKTVEIWTGIAVSRFLPFAEIWSPPNYGGSVDQWIRAGKTWAFELKTAYEDSPTSSIPINLAQLQGHAFRPPHGVPVLYVLPAVPWTSQPLEPVPSVGAAWMTFPWWAWIVSARQLARRLGISAKALPSPTPGTVFTSELPFPHPARAGWILGMSLAGFLSSVGACREPRGWAMRTHEDRPIEELALGFDNATADQASSYFTIHVPAVHLPGPL
jgi:hypothetical protein